MIPEEAVEEGDISIVIASSRSGRAAMIRASRRACFDTALAFLGGFGSPFGVILGNHDLEGDEFETDEQNLAAWHEASLSLLA